MTTKAPLLDGLPFTRVAVLENGQHAPQDAIACTIGVNLHISTETLETYLLSSWKPIAFDALLIAAAVEFCDRIQKRPNLGWGRHFEVSVPVHDVEHWSAPKIREALVGALEFLTGDRWRFDFVKRRKVQESQPQAVLPIPSGITTIIPFSDGMDSRAVSALYSRKSGKSICRVRLGAKSIDQKKAGRNRQPFTTVPYRVSTGKRSGETSARSRGFKFATVSGIAAYLVGANEIIVPESGQGALGPALVPTGHGYEDYRNHPLFTERMTHYFQALLGVEIQFLYPRLWNTKGQTLAEFAKITREQAHVDARSCWQSSRQVSVEGERRQCGICAACMLRRLSVHAAGLKEPRETYLWEKLEAPEFEAGAAKGFMNITKALREYAIAGTLHLDHLARLRKSPVHRAALKRRAHQLAPSQGLSPEEAEIKLERFLEQHEKEWMAFLRELGPKSFVTKWAAPAA